MTVFFAIILAASFVMIAFHYWKRFCGDQLVGEEWHEFLRWIFCGAAVPLFLWFSFNVGFFGSAVWPTVAPLSAGIGVWWSTFDRPAAAGVFFVTSYWSGITLVWLLARTGQRAQDRDKFLAVCRSWSILALPVFILPVLLAGWEAVGLALMLAGGLLLHATLGLLHEKPPAPSYARALAKISFGKYEEAEMEVIRELEQYENDFEGWMMLAELYATHFNDLPAATDTIEDLCAQPSIAPSQISVALHRLADWHLKLAHDPVAARKVLEQICARMPGTHLDRMARQRIGRLPATRKELEEIESGRPLPLPSIPDEEPIGERLLSRDQAAAAASRCVEALKRNPDDVPARERFARLLAENLGDARTGIEQLELLLAMAGQAEARRAEWLLLIAQWHARYGNDIESARLVYQQVMRDFPSTVHALAAQRRLNLLNLRAQVRRRPTAA